MYIELLSQYDMYARKYKTKEEYMDAICNNFVNLNFFEHIRLSIACDNADIFFRDEMSSIYIPDNHNIHNMKWNFIITSGDIYENGYPHTRSNIIFLPRSLIYSDNLVSTLIHEKIHIYQRYNSNRIDELLKINGFTRYKTRDNYSLIRANPDLNNWVYKGRDGIPMYYEYRSETPIGIDDVVRYGESEHPYELIAYEVEKQYKENNIILAKIR